MEKEKTRNERLRDYIFLAKRRRKVTFEELASKCGLPRTTFTYRLENDLLTFDEVSNVFELLGTTDETKLKLMK